MTLGNSEQTSGVDAVVSRYFEAGCQDHVLENVAGASAPEARERAVASHTEAQPLL